MHPPPGLPIPRHNQLYRPIALAQRRPILTPATPRPISPNLRQQLREAENRAIPIAPAHANYQMQRRVFHLRIGDGFFPTLASTPAALRIDSSATHCDECFLSFDEYSIVLISKPNVS